MPMCLVVTLRGKGIKGAGGEPDRGLVNWSGGRRCLLIGNLRTGYTNPSEAFFQIRLRQNMFRIGLTLFDAMLCSALSIEGR